jgi:uncharacterized lipoprotein NlpE involved in copper resistance
MKYFSSIVIALVLFSCSTNKKKEVDTSNTLPVSQSKPVFGAYEGVFPCSDCEGIYYKLSLLEDSSFIKENIYLGKPYHSSVLEGSWSLSGSKVTLYQEGEFASHYILDQGNLYAVDSRGKRISNEYRLKPLKPNQTQKEANIDDDLIFQTKNSDFELRLTTDSVFFTSPSKNSTKSRTETAFSWSQKSKAVTAALDSVKISIFPTACQGNFGEVSPYSVQVTLPNGQSSSSCMQLLDPRFHFYFKWKLETTSKKDIYLRFSPQEKKVSGFDGCNQFFGNYTRSSQQRISMGPLSSTRKFCKNNEIGDTFMQALSRVNRYDFRNQKLILLEDKEVLMTLVH